MMRIRVAASFYDRLEQLLEKNVLSSRVLLVDPVNIETSPLFPFENDCLACNGSGEGAASTYCRKCRGAGRIRVVGTLQPDAGFMNLPGYPIHSPTITLLMTPLPKRFAPYFPGGLVPPRNPVKIVA